jgi:hypothetical protein
MEKFVVSRELAERLDGADYPQDTMYIWLRTFDGRSWSNWQLEPRKPASTWPAGSEQFPAPLSDELLEQLPEYGLVSIVNSETDLTLDENGKPNKKWVLDYTLERQGYPSVIANSPANALAKLWLWLKEHGHVQ